MQGDLSLSHNQIATLPIDVGRLCLNHSLDLSHNRLEELPASFRHLVVHDHLLFNHNNLVKLPKGFGRMSLNGDLHLQRNALERLPTSMEQWHVGGDLRLDRNELKGIPNACRDMVVLGEIWLASNPLDGAPPAKLKHQVRLHSKRSGCCTNLLRHWFRDCLIGVNALSLAWFMLSTFEVSEYAGWRVAKALQFQVCFPAYFYETMLLLACSNATWRTFERFFRPTPKAWRRHVLVPLIIAHFVIAFEQTYQVDFETLAGWFNYYCLTLINFLVHGMFVAWVNLSLWNEEIDPQDAVLA